MTKENEATHSANENMVVTDIRKECLKLSHSAGKSLLEILNDAEVFTAWVMTGKKPKQN